MKDRSPRFSLPWSAGVGLAASLLLAGCSVKNYAINEIASTLAEGSGSAFAAESDIELAGEAIPFSLKLVESLLAASPDNADLLAAAAAGFTQYANGWVEQPADFVSDDDFYAAQRGYERATALYLRAYDYGLRGLEVRHPGIGESLATDPVDTVEQLTAEDVELAYWTAAGLGSAISLSRTDPEMLARLPIVKALAARALALEPTWNLGAIHELVIKLEASSMGDWGTARRTILDHYDEAVRISAGASASPYVALAEAICIQDQDRPRFESLLREALTVDADAHPENRLAILIAQRRAEWLLGRTEDLFLE